MKYFFFVAFVLNFSSGFAQVRSDSVLFSNNGKFVITFDNRYNPEKSYNFITIRPMDSLRAGISFILKDDSIFTLKSGYAGQYGYYFYIGNKRTNNIIYDTLLLDDFYLDYGFNKNEWAQSEIIQFVVDTLKTFEEKLWTDVNYFIYPNDTINLSVSYEFEVKFLYNDFIIYSRVIKPNFSKIVNIMTLKYSELYFDPRHNNFFLYAFYEWKEYIVDSETYELKTITSACEILETGTTKW